VDQPWVIAKDRMGLVVGSGWCMTTREEMTACSAIEEEEAVVIPPS
jgi:hypothetical protein